MLDLIFSFFESIPWQLALGTGFLLLFLNGTISTPPSEISLSVLGLYASSQTWLYLPSILSASVGNILGCMILYEVSRRNSYWISEKIKTSRYKYIRHLYERVELGFSTHGDIYVLVGRWVPNVRSIISVPAGVSKMPRMKFFFFSFLGCIVWSIVWVSVGYFFGKNLFNVLELQRNIALLLLLIMILVLLFHYYKFRGKNI